MECFSIKLKPLCVWFKIELHLALDKLKFVSYRLKSIHMYVNTTWKNEIVLSYITYNFLKLANVIDYDPIFPLM